MCVNQASDTDAMMHYSQLTKEELDKILDTNLDDFGLNSHITGVLDTIGIYNMRGLLYATEDQLLQLRGFNTKTLERVRLFLRSKGFY